jgi:sulfopyruvate decarboxylase TPP-binding subunit
VHLCGSLVCRIARRDHHGKFRLRSATEALGRLYYFPVLLLMSYRGDVGDRAFFGRPTEPILQALEIPYVTVRKEADIAVAIRDVIQTFDTALGPVAMLFSGETVR